MPAPATRSVSPGAGLPRDRGARSPKAAAVEEPVPTRLHAQEHVLECESRQARPDGAYVDQRQNSVPNRERLGATGAVCRGDPAVVVVNEIDSERVSTG